MFVELAEGKIFIFGPRPAAAQGERIKIWKPLRACSDKVGTGSQGLVDFDVFALNFNLSNCAGCLLCTSAPFLSSQST